MKKVFTFFLAMAIIFGISGCGKKEYIVDAEGILVSLTKYLTLFPGDVVSLGRISTLLEVPADIVAKDGIHGTAGIEGLGELPFHFVKDTEAEEAETVREGF